MPKAITREFFGHMLPGDFILPGGELARPVTVLIGLLRFWDSHAVWKYLARHGPGGIVRGTDNQDRWEPDLAPSTALEDSIIYAESIGAQSMFTFGRPPIFSCREDIGDNETVPTVEAWEAFIRLLFTQSAGRIGIYEGWNEPELLMYWQGSPGLLVEYMRVLYRLKQELAPDSILLAPAMTELSTEHGRWFADEYFRLGGGECCDAASIHHYSDNPEKLVPDWNTMTGILEKYGLSHLSIYCTEFNFTDADLNARNAKIAQFMILLASLGGECGVYDSEPQPAARAYTDDTMQRVADLLVGATLGEIRYDGGTRRVTLSRQDKQDTEVSWTDTTFPALGAVTTSTARRGCNPFGFLQR